MRAVKELVEKIRRHARYNEGVPVFCTESVPIILEEGYDQHRLTGIHAPYSQPRQKTQSWQYRFYLEERDGRIQLLLKWNEGGKSKMTDALGLALKRASIQIRQDDSNLRSFGYRRGGASIPGTVFQAYERIIPIIGRKAEVKMFRRDTDLYGNLYIEEVSGVQNSGLIFNVSKSHDYTLTALALDLETELSKVFPETALNRTPKLLDALIKREARQ